MADSARIMTPTGPTAVYKLGVANALWGRTGERFQADFLLLSNRVYGGGFREVDFARDREACRATINGWVAEKTENRIPELLLKNDITSGTVLVLTNAIYFKGEWEQPFPVGETHEGDFEPVPGEKVRLPFMHVTAKFGYRAS